MIARSLTIAVFASCALALVVLDARARQHRGVVTLDTLFRRLMSRRTVRVAVVLAWAWLGWHFLGAPPQS